MISTCSSSSLSSSLSSSFLLKGRLGGGVCNRMIRMPQHTKHIRLGNKNHISTSTTAAIGGGSSSSAGKTKQRYLCQDCGEDYSQWYGQCPVCKAWDSMKVFREPISNANGGSNKGKSGGGAGAAAAQRAQSNNTDRELKSSSSLIFKRNSNRKSTVGNGWVSDSNAPRALKEVLKPESKNSKNMRRVPLPGTLGSEIERVLGLSLIHI